MSNAVSSPNNGAGAGPEVAPTLAESTGSWTELRDLHVAYAQNRDPAIRAELLEHYAGLATTIVNRFSSRPDERDDVHQVAMIGLLKALDRYEPDRGIQFSTYAWATVHGEVKRYFRDHSWSVRVPRQLQELFLRTARAIDELTTELSRSPTVPEIADYTGASDEDVVLAIELRGAQRPVSFDAPRSSGDERTLEPAAIDEGLVDVEHRRLLSPLIERLAPRQQEILHLRFAEDLTQSQIAARVGLSQMHVSRLLSQSLQQLREWASAE